MNKDNCVKLDWWLEKLVPVVEKICEAGIHRKIDGKFWSEIYKPKGGSGGPYITGWITKFFPYLADDKVNTFKKAITPCEFAKQYAKIPFIWNYLGEKIPMSFYGGFLGAEFDKETLTVKPAYFWSVNYDETEVTEDKEYEEGEEEEEEREEESK